MKFDPTPEQAHATSVFIGGSHTKLEAGAGCAKTTTLKLFGKAVPDEEGVYIAFNSSIAGQAKLEFPRNVECRTMHSFGFRAIGTKYVNAGRPLPPRAPRIRPSMAASILGINQGYKIDGGIRDGLVLGPAKFAAMAIECVKFFCYSADDKISYKHVPYVNGSELWPDEARKEIATLVVAYAQRAWQDITNLHGQLRFEHDYYLKMYALTDPVIECDFLMLDEGQDSNPVTLQIFDRQMDHDTQLVMVGDRCQSIYGWRGATNAMETWEADEVSTLSKSFRFGPAIAEEANKWLTLLDAPLRLEGHEPVGSVVTSLDHPTAILCRTNAQVIAEAMAAQDNGKRVHIEGGTMEIVMFAEAARDLMAKIPVNHPELMGFKDWGEVTDYVAQDDSAKDLRVFVQIINAYGVDKVLSIASITEKDAKRADLTVSTAHKAKGREYNQVRIAEDFREPVADESGEDAKVPRADAMLAYVSVTRAMHALDVGGLSWVDRWVARKLANDKIKTKTEEKVTA